MKKVKLGDILTLQRGYDLTSNQMKNGNIPVAASNGVIGYHNVSKAKAPCITIGRSGSVGSVHFYNQEIWVHNTSLFVTDFKNNKPKYLYYLLKSLNFKFLAKSSVVPSLNRNFLYPIAIPFIDNIKIQNKIANILSNIDDKIENNNKISAKLEQMAKFIYDYYFVQFDYPDENGKPYKSSGGAMKHSEILNRQIPTNWEVVKVKDILEVKTGKEDANFSTKNGKYAFFTCAEKPLKCDISAFSGSAILIAGNGSFAVNHYTGDFNAYQRTYVLVPPKKYYAVLFIEAEKSIKKFKNSSCGSIVKFITKGDIENISILKDIDDKKYNQLNNIFEKIEFLEKENQKLSSLRDFLLPMLMNGQVGFKGN